MCPLLIVFLIWIKGSSWGKIWEQSKFFLILYIEVRYDILDAMVNNNEQRNEKTCRR